MNKAYAYTYSFLSFLTPKLKHETVKNIIIFGSLTRGEFTKDSDIDLFIELYDNDKKDNVEKSVEEALTQFVNSDTYKTWRLRKINNRINCLVGVLEKQSDLKRSIISNGKVLYGKYPKLIKGKNHTLFSLKPITEKNKRYRLFRNIFGRKEKKITTKGLVKKLGGKQLSTRLFIIPIEQTPIILKLLQKEKVDY